MGYLNKVLRLLGADSRRGHAAADAGAELAPATPAEAARAGEALRQAGNAALAQQDYAKALACFQQAVDLRHDDADAHYGMGVAALRLDHDEDAADCFQLAAHFRPEFAEAHFCLGRLARRGGDERAAQRHLERALGLRPDYAQAHNLAGACALALGDVVGALRSFARAVELMPESANFHSDLGYVLLHDCGEFERGAAHIRSALALDDASPTIWCNYCAVLWHEGRLAEIIAVCDRLIAADPHDHDARLNRALALLKQERFGEAWPDYEARKLTRSNFARPPYAFPEWRGQSLAGRTVLVCGEQGVGDEIMFASCFPDLLQTAGLCVIECSPRLASLFQRSFPAATVHGVAQTQRNGESLKHAGAIDYRVDAGSLPGFFRHAATEFPAHAGYLRADEARVAHWRRHLAALGAGLKIGLAWRGGAVSTRRAMRSLDLAALAPLLQQPKCHFISLQHDADQSEIAAAATAVQVHHWPDVVRDLDETAALVSALDLVITVCTATAHITGSLGRPGWVLVPAVPEWRYLERGATMPWYPSLRLFRQRQAGDWPFVIQEVVRALADMNAARC